MALNKREKYIMIAAVLAVAVLAGDSLLITPMLEKRAALSTELSDAQSRLDKSRSILKQKNAIEKHWNELSAKGLTENAEELESSVLRYLKDSSVSCGVSLSGLQPEIKAVKDNMGQMVFTVSAGGSMAAISEFLWNIETSQLPIAVINIQLGSVDETATRMNLQLKLSSVYLAPQKQQKGKS